MNDFRAALERLVELDKRIEDVIPGIEIDNWIDAMDAARAALAQPEVEGPSDQQLCDLWEKEAEYFALYGEALRFGHAVLARWGRHAPAPKPIPVSERLPEDGDCLVVTLLEKSIYCRFCWQAREIMLCGQARLIWDLGMVPLTTAENWPFTYWLPASTQLLPTTVDSDQPT